MSGFVYLWENTTNGKLYVGSHKGSIGDKYIGSGVYFKRAYKLNPNNFKRHILYIGKDYLAVENTILKFFNAAENESFYNLKNEAVGGWDHCHTKEVSEKRARAVSKSKKGKRYDFMFYERNGEKNPMYGKNHKEETKSKISKKRKGVCNFSKPIIEKTENKLFSSVIECASYYGVTQPTMTVLIRNKKINRGACKGKIFNYA